MDLEKGITYNDVMVKPKYDGDEMGSEISLSAEITPGIEVETGLVVETGDVEKAIKIASEGGSIIYEYNTIQDIELAVDKIPGILGLKVEISDWESSRYDILDQDIDFVYLDCEYGYIDKYSKISNRIKDIRDIPIIAGNITTPEAALHLVKNGVTSIEISSQNRSSCIGVPRVTAIKNIRDRLKSATVIDNTEYRLIAGDVTKSGDITKSFCLGTDAVVINGIIDKFDTPSNDEILRQIKRDVFYDFELINSNNISEARENSEFIQI